MHGRISSSLSRNEEERSNPPDFTTIAPLIDLSRTIESFDDPILHMRKSVTRDLVFQSETMKNIVTVVDRLSNKDRVPVLVLGESGTGKTMLCKLIHDLGPRRARPFVEIGCSNIPDNLIESELFGYEKGAFTDAKTSKKGLVEIAEGGTLFLDEIGDMPLALQSKLLGLIEERTFRKIGGLRQFKADVRIIAATNRNLTELVGEGRFRLDLYYRLNVVAIEIPPLSSRAEDIPALINHYLQRFGAKYECDTFGITQDALNTMRHYPWPGNVRELKNLMEKLVIMSRFQPIEVDDLPGYMMLPHKSNTTLEAALRQEEPFQQTGSNSENLSLKVLEEASIRAALKTTKGNQRKAAKLLDITRDTLRYRIKKLGITPDDPAEPA